MTMQQPEKVLGRARGYRDLIAVLRAVYEEKQISRDTVDEQCGLPERHASRLLTDPPLKNFGPTSLTLLLQRSGLELWVVQRADSPIDTWPKRKRRSAEAIARACSAAAGSV